MYLNAANIPVDADGLLLGFKDVKRLDSAHWDEALSGPQLTPAAFLAAVAANPRLPLSIRIDAAKSAAPYTDRKKPLALDGGTGTDGAPLPLLSIDKLKGLPTGELKTLLALLSKAGVSV